MTDFINLKIVLILAIGFSLAALLGYLSYKIHLSPIFGYLAAGFVIGPYCPGFEADLQIAEQLAEIGVILMMFGVGMHFRWKDLVHVKHIAILGGAGQMLITAVVTAVFLCSLGWSLISGLLFGLSIGLASTIVLVRVLTDNNLLSSAAGHITVGWSIVEDFITVLILLLIPIFADASSIQGTSLQDIGLSIAIMLLKFVLLIMFMFTIGQKAVTFILGRLGRFQSHELFTLAMLALTFGIAVGSALIFGTSIALGAFIAGMVIGQTSVRILATDKAAPLKDAFVVIFFISVGMLFNPFVVGKNLYLFFTILSIILVIKPTIAFLISMALKKPIMTAVTVALGLAQIGELSFILSEVALKLHIFSDEGYDIIVACALASISLNPILFKILKRVQG
jgi:CPA2 family monovalent cation:H+ antiporter-2